MTGAQRREFGLCFPAKIFIPVTQSVRGVQEKLMGCSSEAYRSGRSLSVLTSDCEPVPKGALHGISVFHAATGHTVSTIRMINTHVQCIPVQDCVHADEQLHLCELLARAFARSAQEGQERCLVDGKLGLVQWM